MNVNRAHLHVPPHALVVSLLLLVLTLSSCYHNKQPQAHFYGRNYNFVVKSDSLSLIRQMPEEKVSQMRIDSFQVARHSRLVVADFRTMPHDSTDTSWVLVATERGQFGWIHESTLLKEVVPDDPISQFISTFSDIHLLIFLVVIVLIGVAYLVRLIHKRNAKIVHFNDIDSFYPTLLCLIVAASATLYASIQLFAPDTWRHFYYHPTLNPFSVPLILSVFLCSVWAMLIVAIAATDVVRQQLPFGQAMLYLFGLAGVCAVCYIVFSVSTLYFVGYILLALYFYYAIRAYFKKSRVVGYCGHCGAPLHHKGRCPMCGTLNE